jgi:peptidoglycan/LPS O-acetylase OafA/YrhL
MARTTGGGLERRNRGNRRNMQLWSLAWAMAYIGSAYLIRFAAIGAQTVVALAVVTGAMGLGALLAYRRFLRDADELQRKIELDALALGVGAGVVGGTAIHVLEQGTLLGEYALTAVLMLIFATYIAAVLAGHRRFA